MAHAELQKNIYNCLVNSPMIEILEVPLTTLETNKEGEVRTQAEERPT